MVGRGEGRVRIRLHRLCGATLPMNIVEKVGFEFLDGFKRDVEMGHLFSLNGKADGENRCAWR